MADKKQDSVFAADQKRIAEETEQQLARTENVQPTPTQEENDRAKLGVSNVKELDNKQPDGSPERQRGVSTSGTGGFQNRSIETK